MSIPKKPKKTTNVTEVTGFRQANIDQFLKQGFTAAGRQDPEVNNTPQQETVAQIVDRSSRGFFGGTTNTSESERFIPQDVLSNLNKSQVDAFVSAFATRASSIRQRRRAPGRRQTIFSL